MCLFSQAPGYMGKKVTIGCSAALHPNAFSFFYSSDLKYTHPIFTYSAYSNFVIAKCREISLAVRFSNRKINNAYYSEDEGAIIPEYERFSLLEYSLSIKRFSKIRFAPIGIYAKWEIFYLSGQINYDAYVANGYDLSTQSYKPFNYSAGEINFHGFGGAYSLGKQRVFADKIVIDYGFRPSFMFIKPLEESSHYEEYLAKYSSGPLNGIPIMHVYFGIGFLAF